MARRYVNPHRQQTNAARRSLPDLEYVYGREGALVARAIMDAQPSEQPAGIGASGVSAVDSLWDPSAPGAGLNGRIPSLGAMVQDMRTPEGRARLADLQNAWSERVPAEGGFLVGEDLRSDMIMLSLQSAIIRPLATVIPAGEFRTSVPTVEEGATHTSGQVLGGMQFSWVDAGVSIGATAAGFGRVTLEAKKLAGYTTAPNELLADADQLDAFLRQAVPAGIASAEDLAFIAGTGVGEPQGILSASCAISVTRQTSSAVTLVDVAKMTTRMLPKSMNKFIWLCSPDVLAQLLEIYLNFGSATSGIVPPPGWLSWHPVTGQWTLLGRPLISNEYVSAMGTKGDLVAVDPSFYVIADRKMLQVALASDGAGFIKDETEIRVTERLDGRIWLASAVTPQNSSVTVSPVIILN